MEPSVSDVMKFAPAGRVAGAPGTCPTCHQAVQPEYYFCPNCGTNLRTAPLTTSVDSQAALYIFSIILPLIAFIAISKWKGIKYYRSQDPKEHLIGVVAWALLILSTVVTIYLTIIWTQNAIQSSVNSINADMGI